MSSSRVKAVTTAAAITFLWWGFKAFVEANLSEAFEATGANTAWRQLPSFSAKLAWSVYDIIRVIFDNPVWIGIVIGAIVFAAPEFTAFQFFVRKWRLYWARRNRDPAADGVLADKCDELAGEFVHEAAEISRVTMEYHWADRPDDKATQNNWLEARRAEAKAQQRVQQRLGQKVLYVLTELRRRGIQMEMFHFSLTPHDYVAVATFFTDMAAALRSGEYVNKVFRVDPFRSVRF